MWYEFRSIIIVHKKIKIIDTNLGLSIFNYVLRNNKSFLNTWSQEKRIDQQDIAPRLYLI